MSGFTAPHCGSLRASDEGHEVELYGWVARRRDHGAVIFIDLRDRWGAVQVVIRDVETLSARLRLESVVRVRGKVQRRPGGSENPRMATGEVEVVSDDLEILSESQPTPFPIEDPEEPDEKNRLEYRYLDLRRPHMTKMLELRNKVNRVIRDYMEEREFIEVETPILTRSSPSGARDFLVPSRLHPGSFYALPQAPQMLKQLLMVSGVQRYYQIARCFRDENLRADRQPEFTQLDVEMSFCDEEDVFTLIEGLFAQLWQKILGITLPVPFPRLDIKESYLRYGTDKPDLRYELEISDLGDALRETRAEIFRKVLAGGGVVREGEWKFLWINPTYLFEEDDQGKLTYAHHPFTRPFAEDMPFVEERPYDVRAHAYDIVCNGYELGGGSLRIYDPAMQERVFQLLGMPLETIRARFGTLLEAFTYGVPPHGGIAPGIDRIVMMLGGTDNIRDVIAFPKTQSMSDLMLGAPAEVDSEQLDELHVKVVPPQKASS